MTTSGEDVEVLAVDQQKFNKFSRLSMRLKEIALEIDMLKGRVVTCNDALEEAEMCLDPDGMLLGVGESFFEVSEEEASDYLLKAKKATDELMSKYQAESEIARTELGSLKKELYAKFGSSINLEEK